MVFLSLLVYITQGKPKEGFESQLHQHITSRSEFPHEEETMHPILRTTSRGVTKPSMISP